MLLILAAIGISVLTGENGIINNSKEAKEQTEIDNEKEIVNISTVQAVDKNPIGNITKKELQESLDNNTEKNKTKVYTEDEEYFLVEFVETKRVYKVDRDGNVTQEDSNILTTDDTPGEFEGNGTEQDPYTIMSIEDLVALAIDTNQNENDYYGKYIQFGKTLNFNSELSYYNYETTEYNEFLGVADNVGLMEALTNESYTGFEPIGTFTGTLRGNNYSLKNIYINKEQDAGLFKNLEHGTVENLEITGKIICNGNNAGAISARGGIIRNCISRVDIQATGSYIGGIKGGDISSTVTNCQNYGKIEGVNYVGGITAFGNGKVKNCQNYGDITGNWAIGGINGRYASVSDCENYGKITATADSAGGIVGTTGGSGCDIWRCINYGEIRAIKNAAGIAGATGASGNASIIDCINMGNIIATGSQAGGIAGAGAGFGYIFNCYNIGNITSNNGGGGIIGAFEFTGRFWKNYKLLFEWYM